MEFEKFLTDDNFEFDVEETIEANATNSTINIEDYEGEIKPFIFY